MKKKLYYVKYEVMARNIKEAVSRKGKVYEVLEASEQPSGEKAQPGFKTK